MNNRVILKENYKIYTSYIYFISFNKNISDDSQEMLQSHLKHNLADIYMNRTHSSFCSAHRIMTCEEMTNLKVSSRTITQHCQGLSLQISHRILNAQTRFW